VPVEVQRNLDRGHLDNRAFLGLNVMMTSDKYPSVNSKLCETRRLIVEDDVSIGFRAIVLSGVHGGFPH
jgi:hypothetical protein